MINEKDLSIFLQRLFAIRELLFSAIKQSGSGKSYDGAIEIVIPGYFHEKQTNCEYWGINLHCYSLGPGSHYEWRGRTILEAIDKAEKDITKWCLESEAEALEDEQIR